MFGGELLEFSIGYRKWLWHRVEIKWWIIKYLKRLNGSKRKKVRVQYDDLFSQMKAFSEYIFTITMFVLDNKSIVVGIVLHTE